MSDFDTVWTRLKAIARQRAESGPPMVTIEAEHIVTQLMRESQIEPPPSVDVIEFCADQMVLLQMPQQDRLAR